MTKIGIEARKRIIVLKRVGYTVPEIHKRIEKEEERVFSKRSVYRVCKKFKEFHTILDLPRNKRAKKSPLKCIN